MTTTTGLIAAVMAAGALGVLDYGAVPALVSICALTGVIDMPASMEWVGSIPAVAAGVGLYGLSLISARLKRPPRLKAAERAIGLPLTVISIGAVAVAAAASAGLEGHLLSEGGRSALLDTGSYSGNDVTVLALVGLVATPMAVAGKGVRAVTRRAPGAKTIQSTVAVAGVGASALLMQLPAEARVFLAAVMLLVFAALFVGIVRRSVRLIRWWRFDSGGASARERLAVAAETALPGAGYFILGKPYSGVPRLILTAALLVVLVVFGVFGLPLYFFVSLGKALSLAHEIGTALPPDDDEPRDSQLGSAGLDFGPTLRDLEPQTAHSNARPGMEW